MSRNLVLAIGPLLAALPIGSVSGTPAAAQDLSSFGVVAGQSLTNTGPTTIVGNIAVSPGSSYTGSGSVTHTGSTHLADPVAIRVQNDLTSLYAVLAGRPTSNGGDLTGQDLGGLTLAGGVYHFDSSASIAAGQVLTLDGGGNPDAVFVFNIGSTLTTGSGARVRLVNGAQGGNVFYRVGSSATLDTSSVLEGQIVALTSITLNTAAAITCGAALARNGSVTLDTNTIRFCTFAAPQIGVVASDPTVTANDRAVATALTGNVAIALLAATQTPAELAFTLGQLSGEVSTAVAPTGLQSTSDFLDTVVGYGRQPRNGPMPLRNDGAPVGLVREKINTAYTGKYGSEPAAPVVSYPASAGAQAGPWAMWLSGYGSRSVIDGDLRQGSSQRTASNKGVAAGVTFASNEYTSFGIAVSQGKADFALADAKGGGTSDARMVAFHGRTGSDRGYVEGAIAFGRSDITTELTITVAGTDRLGAETTGQSVGAHLEAGYHMGRVTPFVGLRAQSFKTAAYTETALSGSGTYALGYPAATTTSVRSELGVDLQWNTNMNTGATSSFGLRAAWGHEFSDDAPVQSAFVTAPGATVPISGATRDRDSLKLSANFGVAASNGFSVGGAVDFETSSNERDYGGSVRVGYRW